MHVIVSSKDFFFQVNFCPSLQLYFKMYLVSKLFKKDKHVYILYLGLLIWNEKLNTWTRYVIQAIKTTLHSPDKILQVIWSNNKTKICLYFQ